MTPTPQDKSQMFREKLQEILEKAITEPYVKMVKTGDVLIEKEIVDDFAGQIRQAVEDIVPEEDILENNLPFINRRKFDWNSCRQQFLRNLRGEG